jgi:threonine synthase
MRLYCTSCSFVAPLEGFPYHCPVCGGILLFEPAPGLRLSGATGRSGLRRFRGLLPLAAADELISLGEGDTPLVPANRLAGGLELRSLLLKNETVNPTGSFKDRALATMTSRARAEGFEHLISSSSGNAGVSSAAYAARAGLRATVLVPEATRRSRLDQILTHGSRVVRVRGSTSDTYALARELGSRPGFANLTTTFLSPLAAAAFATIGYELVEQLEGRVPDWIVVPVSAGPILVGVALAYRLARDSGLVDRVPRMVCAQASGCAPIVRAFECGSDAVEPWEATPETAATAIADPLRGYAQDGTLTLEFVRDTGGLAVAVDEPEIKAAVRSLAAEEGVFAEPAGAVPLAALRRLRESGFVRPSDAVVCVITGHGMKDPGVAAPEVELPLIEPDPVALQGLLEDTSAIFGEDT